MNKDQAFAKICENERTRILEEWKNAVFATYPLDTSGFARTREDPFTNPVGHVTTEALGQIYKAVSGGVTAQTELRVSLEMFVKLRAVQNFTTIQALGVIYLLKPLMRKCVLPACLDAGLLDEYLESESRLDSAALIACEVYAASREQLYEERIGEIKRQQSQITRWARKQEDATSGTRGE